jgi:hypothetical protein
MGRPTSGRRSASPTPRCPAPHRRRCQGKAATGFQWGRPKPGSDGPKALPPEGRGTPRNTATRLPDSCGKPRSTPGARATQRLRPRVASAMNTLTATVEPTSTRGCAEATTPGGGGGGTLRQRGGSESLARTTRSVGFQSRHTTGAVPDLVPNPDYYHKVLGGDETGTVARGLPAGLPPGWNVR